jgi:hypothetical protein
VDANSVSPPLKVSSGSPSWSVTACVMGPQLVRWAQYSCVHAGGKLRQKLPSTWNCTAFRNLPSAPGRADEPVALLRLCLLSARRATVSVNPGAAGWPSRLTVSVAMSCTLGVAGSAMGEVGGKDRFASRSVPGSRS